MAITKNQISEHFDIELKLADGKILLFNKEIKSSVNAGKRYEAYIYSVGNGKYKVEGGLDRSKIGDLLSDIKDWQDRTFKYNQDYYCPSYRDGMLSAFVMWDKLRELGVNDDKLIGKDIYGLDSFGIKLSTTPDYEFANKEDKICFGLHSPMSRGMLVRVECNNDPDEVVKTIDSLLLPYYLSYAATFIEKANLITGDINIDNIKQVKAKNVFDAEIRNMKEDIVKSLQSNLDKLNTTKIISVKDTLCDGIEFDIDVTECCKIGPITTEKYCSNCGKKIIR